MLHFRGGREAISEAVYPNLEDFYADLTAAYRAEIADLAKRGLTYLQFDDTNLAYLCDPDIRARTKARGDDPDALTRLYCRLINDSIRDRPRDMTVCVHLCRGNFKSAWVAQGGYEPVAEILLNEMKIDGFFLEYDDERSGDFAPLRFAPKSATIVLGLMSSKKAAPEPKDDVKRRIDEAAKYVPLEPMRALAPMRLLLDRARQRPRRGRSMDQACPHGRNRRRGLGQGLTADPPPLAGEGDHAKHGGGGGGGRKRCCNERAFKNHRPSSRTAAPAFSARSSLLELFGCRSRCGRDDRGRSPHHRPSGGPPPPLRRGGQMTAHLTWFDVDKCFIGGRWVAPTSGARLPVEDPSRGTEIGEIARGTAADIDAAVEAAERALQGEWGRLTATERGRLLAKLGELVASRVDELARIEALDVGKPLKQGRADALALARYMEFYAGAADKVMGETIPYLGGYTVYTLREPHGVTGHIVPWNYPMQIAGRTVGAALAMGNACVLKPAEEACLTSLALADLAREAGFPDGALNVVPGLGEEAGAALAAHPGVRHISFTGSVAVGALVQAAAARHVAPVTLELGGKSPQVVFADADLHRALPFLVNAGIQNAGQTCSAASRILVDRRVYGEVVERMAARYRTLKVGPADADLDVGPLISEKQKAIVSQFLADGADLKTAAIGEIVDDAPRGGHYVAPTLFADVLPGHRLAQEEIFGPVQVVIPFDDEAEAVAIANGTGYGLVAGLWTADGGRQMRLAKALRAGQVFVNNYGAGGGVELPFGGVGKSGHGREKGFEALYGFSALKTVAAWHG